MVCLQEIHDYLKTVCADMHVTKGDFDEDFSYPEDKVSLVANLLHMSFSLLMIAWLAEQVLKIGDFRIGMVHGHQVMQTV